MTGEDTLLTELEAQRERSAAKRAPEVNALMSEAIERLRRSGIGEQILGAGDPAPDFALPSARGPLVRLEDLRRRGPVAVAFYRGGW